MNPPIFIQNLDGRVSSRSYSGFQFFSASSIAVVAGRIDMPVASSLELSRTQFDRGVLAAFCMKSASSSKNSYGLSRGRCSAISSVTCLVVTLPPLTTL